jgi:hypothetical protein
MSTSLNRRALVAGAAALPVIAIPAAAQCVLQDDAELLALGAQLEPFLQRWLAQNRDDFARIKRGEVGHDEERTVEEWQRGDKERNEVCDALYSLADEILSLTATTKEGLAVQLRAITATDAELWDNKNVGRRNPRVLPRPRSIGGRSLSCIL